MHNIFITKIQVNKVRNLVNVEIPLSDSERKHLIITGKNGSGKTSLLAAMRDIIGLLQNGNNNFGGKTVMGPIDALDLLVFLNDSNHFLKNTACLYIPANRNLALVVPTSIGKVSQGNKFNISVDASTNFLAYMLYLNYQKMSAESEYNTTEASRIANWFEQIRRALRDIYDCPKLELKHDAKNLNFQIFMPDRDPFGLNQMADGYSAFLRIVMDLIMRMDNNANTAYDTPAIALIDEIETHLHVELQKRVLPFLTKMFPNVQFIVTTHSPFVITSIADAVVFDLEKRQRMEDLTAYSYEGIIEYYFGSDMYSEKIKEQFERYKAAISKENRSEEEDAQLVETITYLKQIPSAAAPELIHSFRAMEASRRQGIRG
jgi:predicted ATPase